MMVFWEQRLAFLATPKTASTAIEHALGALAAVVILRPRELKHTDLQHFQTYLQPYLTQAAGGQFELAAVMREPRDWLGSWYRDRQREDVAPDKSTRGLSFEDFVKAYCTAGPRPGYADVGSQARFLTGQGGARVTHLFRYDALAGFVNFLEDRLDCEITLPRLNVSPRGETVLTRRTETLLREVCHEDFTLYEGLGPR